MPSAKILKEKEVVVSALAEKFKSAQGLVLADYRGITVLEDTAMRVELRKNGVDYFVAKNTYVSIAMKEAGIEGMDEYLSGPTAVAISSDDMIAPARILSKYAKQIEKFECKAGIVEGNILDAKGVESIANIPSREVLIAQVLGGLNATITALAVAINAIAEKQGAAVTEAAAE